MQLCRFLRWKDPAREGASLDEVVAAFARNRVHYGCLRTCQPWGPDDELAAPECCNDARGCFEHAPLSRAHENA
ncbi:MAG: hypothetical protein R3B09_19555 [Nannocystaceae bacterium]